MEALPVLPVVEQMWLPCEAYIRIVEYLLEKDSKCRKIYEKDLSYSNHLLLLHSYGLKGTRHARQI